MPYLETEPFVMKGFPVGNEVKRSVLNVGGCSKDIPLPAVFDNYEHILLDTFIIREVPDIVMNAKDMVNQEWMKEKYDAVYCSHTLEHIPRQETGAIFRGFAHVLKPDGFLLVRVPDVVAAIRDMDSKDKEFHQQPFPESENDILRAVTYHDIVYGSDHLIKGNPHQQHLQAFTIKSLQWGLDYVGFRHFFAQEDNLEIQLVAFKNPPTEEIISLLS